MNETDEYRKESAEYASGAITNEEVYDQTARLVAVFRKRSWLCPPERQVYYLLVRMLKDYERRESPRPLATNLLTLRGRMSEYGYEKASLAKASGVPRRVIEDVLNRSRDITDDQLERLEKVLGPIG